MRTKTPNPKSKRGMMLRVGELEQQLLVAGDRVAEALQSRTSLQRRASMAEDRLLEHLSDLNRIKAWELHLRMDPRQDTTEFHVSLKLQRGMRYCPIDTFCRMVADQLTHRLRHSPEFDQESLKLMSVFGGYQDAPLKS